MDKRVSKVKYFVSVENGYLNSSHSTKPEFISSLPISCSTFADSSPVKIIPLRGGKNVPLRPELKPSKKFNNFLEHAKVEAEKGSELLLPIQLTKLAVVEYDWNFTDPKL